MARSNEKLETLEEAVARFTKQFLVDKKKAEIEFQAVLKERIKVLSEIRR